jgi:hypothetical protein
MTPASRERTVAIANSVGFIGYLLVGCVQVRSPAGSCAVRTTAGINREPPAAAAMPVDTDEFRGEVPAPETVISALFSGLLKSRECADQRSTASRASLGEV